MDKTPFINNENVKYHNLNENKFLHSCLHCYVTILDNTTCDSTHAFCYVWLFNGLTSIGICVWSDCDFALVEHSAVVCTKE